MKKLVLTLLMSCVVGTVSAADDGGVSTGEEKALSRLQVAGKFTATKAVPAIVGYVAASAVKERVGSYGFLAFLGLASLPFILDSKKAECYDKVPAAAKTALNSFAAGVAAREVVSLVPAAQSRLAALRN